MPCAISAPVYLIDTYLSVPELSAAIAPPKNERESFSSNPSNNSWLLFFPPVGAFPQMAIPPHKAFEISGKSVVLDTSSDSAVNMIGFSAVPTASIFPPLLITSTVASEFPLSVALIIVPGSIDSVWPSFTYTLPSNLYVFVALSFNVLVIGSNPSNEAIPSTFDVNTISLP